MVVEDEQIGSHASIVERQIHVADQLFRTGYVEGVATAPKWQGRGFGSLAMSRATEWIRARYEFGVLSTSSPGFYERLGWERWRGPSYVRHEDRLVRTEEEDDGLMVLRFRRSAGVDLHAAISCDPRDGDDW